MPRKPIELPPEVTRRFVRDMRDCFADGIKADPVASRRLHFLRHQQHYAGKLRL